jgi:DNA-binding IclR family transcriptional regulator
MNETGQTVQSVIRAMQILECFTLEKPEQSLRELAEQTKLSKSTVYRLLSTLGVCGYIKQNELTQKYSLGFKLFNLGAVIAANISLRDTARPFMSKLCNEVSETIDLNIIEDDQRVCIDMVESSEEIRNIVKVGQRNFLWVGASGKVMLANLEETERRRILDEAIINDQLKLDINDLENELDLIRSSGYVTSIDDRVKGSFAIAAPIFNHTGKLISGLTAAGPIHRLSKERPLNQQVMYTAFKISEAMGDIGAKGRYPMMVLP